MSTLNSLNTLNALNDVNLEHGERSRKYTVQDRYSTVPEQLTETLNSEHQLS